MSDRPTKRDWVGAWLEGLARARFTGEAQLTLYYTDGWVTRLAVKEDSPALAEK